MDDIVANISMMNIVRFVLSRKEYGWDMMNIFETHDEFYEWPRHTIEEEMGHKYEYLRQDIEGLLEMSADDIPDEDKAYLLATHKDLTVPIMLEHLELLKDSLTHIAANPNIPVNVVSNIMCLEWRKQIINPDRQSRYHISKWYSHCTVEQMEIFEYMQETTQENEVYDQVCRRADEAFLLNIIGRNDYTNLGLYMYIVLHYQSNAICQNKHIDFKTFIPKANEMIEYIRKMKGHNDYFEQCECGCDPRIEWSYPDISRSPHITLEYVLEHITEDWDFNAIIERLGRMDMATSSKYFMKLLVSSSKYKDINWTGDMDNEEIYLVGLIHPLLNLEFVAKHLRKIQNYKKFQAAYKYMNELVNECHHILVEYPYGLEWIFMYGTNDTINKYMDKYEDKYIAAFMKNPWFHFEMVCKLKLDEHPAYITYITKYTDIEYVIEHVDDKWDTQVLSMRLPIHLIEQNLSRYDMRYVSRNPSITIEFIRKHKDTINFCQLARNEGLTFAMIDEFHDKLHMWEVSKNGMELEKLSQRALFIASMI
jgi:hypothetical protein